MISYQIIYNILGIPFKDFGYLSQCNAVRSSGSSTALEAGNANKLRRHHGYPPLHLLPWALVFGADGVFVQRNSGIYCFFGWETA